MQKPTTMWFALPAAALLAACGGEDTKAPPPSSSAPTPSPTPAPTPAPTGTIATAPFGLTQDAALGVIGLMKDTGDFRWVSDSEVQMGWLASPATFSMHIEPYGSGVLADDPDEAAPAGLFLVNGEGTRLARVNTFVPNPATGASAFSLQAFWGPLTGSVSQSASSGTVLYYSKAAVTSPPKTGSASYNFGVAAESQARLEFDFAAGLVRGEVPLTYSDAWGPYPETRYALQNGKYDKLTGQFSGTFAIPDSGFAGEVRGQIVGPSGEAMAIAIRGAVYDPYKPGWVESFSLIDRLRN